MTICKKTTKSLNFQCKKQTRAEPTWIPRIFPLCREFLLEVFQCSVESATRTSLFTFNLSFYFDLSKKHLADELRMDKQEEVRIDGIFDTFCVDKSVIKSDRSDKSGNFLEFKLNQRKK